MVNEPDFIPRKPDFSGNGVDIWVNLDKNGRKYLAIRILNSIKLVAFRNEETPIIPPVNVADSI